MIRRRRDTQPQSPVLLLERAVVSHLKLLQSLPPLGSALLALSKRCVLSIDLGRAKANHLLSFPYAIHLPARASRLGITAIDEFEPQEFAWCSAPTPATPRSRLRSVTLTGNLLVICFVLGLGLWSGFAPLESAAIASGVVESEFEPQDDSTSRGRYHQGDSGRRRRRRAQRTDTDRVGRHQGPRRGAGPSGPVMGRRGTGSAASGRAAGAGAAVVSRRTGNRWERECIGRGDPGGAAKHL